MGSIIFNRGMRDVAGTKPQRLRLGDWYCEPLTWDKAMEMTAKALLFDIRYRDRLLKNLRSIRGFDAVSAGMHIPRKLESNLYLECKRSANGCLRTIRLLLEAAAFPSGEASVEYTEVPHAETEETNSKQSSTIDDVAAAPPPPKMTGPEPYTAYPKRELFTALAEDRIPDEDFDKLLTLEGTRAILGMTPRHDTPVFSLMPQRFFWRDPATRRGKTVFVTAQWFERDKARLDKLLSRWRETLHDTSTTPDMKRFLDDICEHWPEGFDFSDGAVRLLEGRCGSLSPGMERQLKAVMFRLRGGIWLVPDSVAPKEAIDTVLREADRSISDAGFVSIAFLAKAKVLERSRLSTENDRCAFVEHVLSSNGFTIAEHNGVKFATAGDSFSDGDFGNWCVLVRKAVEASGALPFAHLMQAPAFGNIDEDAAFALLREYEPKVIPEHDPDGGLQFKMLSEYYLPEDM